MRSRDRWLRYKTRPCQREKQVGEVAQIVWPLILKAARASDVDGRICFVPGTRPVDALLAHLGGRPIPEGRYYARALQELTSVGLVSIERDAIVVNDWQDYRPSRERKSDGFSWLLLKAFESNAFRSLPPMCRGFAHLLLRAADSEGYLPGDVEGMLDRLGWQSYHRRVVGEGGELVKVRRYVCEKGHVDRWAQMLRDARYFVAEGAAFRIEKYTEYQPGAEPERHAGIAPTSRRGHADITPRSRPHHAEKEPNPVESLRTGVRDLTGSDLIRENPPNPPRGEPEGGGLFSNAKAGQNQSHEAPDLPADRPAWYREICAAFGRVDAELAAWAEAQRAAQIAGSGESLAAQTLERLSWQLTLTRWRKSGGQFKPSLANYFARGHWTDERPADPALFADPTESPAERKAREEAARAAARERDREEIRAEAQTPKPSHAERIRLLWEAMPDTRAYKPPVDPESREIAERVLVTRAIGLRATQPDADWPALLASLFASRPELEPSPAPPPENSESRDFVLVPQKPAHEFQPKLPAVGGPLENGGKLLVFDKGVDAPVDQPDRRLLEMARMAAKRCEAIDKRLRALEHS